MDVLAVALAVLNLGAPLELPFESTVVVTGREASCAFALNELDEIVKKACGQAFRVKAGGEGEQWSFEIFSVDLRKAF